MIEPSSTPNVIDLVCLSIIAVSCLIGFLKGFVKDLIGTAAMVVAFFVVLYGEPFYLPLVVSFAGDSQIVRIIVGIVLFIIVSGIFTLIADYLSRAVHKTAMGGLDRTLGVAFGAVRGAVIISIFYLVAGLVTSELPHILLEARFSSWYLSGANVLNGLIPEGSLGLKTNISMPNLDPKKLYKTYDSLDKAVEEISNIKPKLETREETNDKQ